MSLKLYDAYKINLNFFKTFEILKELRNEYRKDERKFLFKSILKETVEILDQNKAFGKKFKFYDKEKMESYEDDMAILGYNLEKYNLGSKNKYTSYSDKFHNFTIMLYPIRENETLIRAFFSDDHQRKIFESYSKKYNFEDYHLQNSSDDLIIKLSKEKWDQRESDWREAGVFNLSKKMLIFNISLEEPSYLTGHFLKNEYKKYIPSIDERVESIYKEIVEIECCKILLKDVDPEKRYSFLVNNKEKYIKETKRFRESEEGIKKLTEIKNLLKEIEWSDLCTKISLLENG